MKPTAGELLLVKFNLALILNYNVLEIDVQKNVYLKVNVMKSGSPSMKNALLVSPILTWLVINANVRQGLLEVQMDCVKSSKYHALPIHSTMNKQNNASASMATGHLILNAWRLAVGEIKYILGQLNHANAFKATSRIDLTSAFKNNNVAYQGLSITPTLPCVNAKMD